MMPANDAGMGFLFPPLLCTYTNLLGIHYIRSSYPCLPVARFFLCGILFMIVTFFLSLTRSHLQTSVRNSVATDILCHLSTLFISFLFSLSLISRCTQQDITHIHERKRQFSCFSRSCKTDAQHFPPAPFLPASVSSSSFFFLSHLFGIIILAIDADSHSCDL